MLAEQAAVLRDLDPKNVGRLKAKTRGRPKGSKDKKKRGRRTKEEMKSSFFAESTQGVTANAHWSPFAANASLDAILEDCFLTSTLEQDLEYGEVLVEVFLQFSIGEALKSEDAPKWVQAIDKEKTKLLAFETWRKLNDEEVQAAKNPVPIALLLTIKRDGTYKCRAVCLGNLYKHDGHLDVYASVISQTATRYMLVDAAASGDHVVLFDIDNAFVQSFIDTDVFVRLPKQWRENVDDTGLRKLIKALYGLPQAPRLWAKHYESKLKELGWQQSDSRGLWKKNSNVVYNKYLRLGVFVDDNTTSGPDKNEVDREVQAILRVFPGKIIPAENMGDGWIRYDLLGTDVWYCRQRKELKIVMERYIKKIAQKFRMEGCRKADSPCFQEAMLYDESSPRQDYPLREAIGCLSWAANVCRVDICHPVNLLARATARSSTKGIVSCIKKVFRYLINHPEIGLYYSPENEMSFNETYSSLRADSEPITDWNVFSDASFASCFITMKSVSGSIIYYRACPIAWKCARQTIRTGNTFESEYVAASDTIKVLESLDFRGFFGDCPDDQLWLDNQSAVTVAKTATAKERPKSRHIALRYMKVSEVGDKIRFCPTQHQKADVLTKSNVSQDIRNHVFHHNPSMKHPRKMKEEETEVEEMFTVSDEIQCCFYSVLEYFEA